METWAPELTNFVSALERLPDFSGTVYRGIVAVSKREADAFYIPGRFSVLSAQLVHRPSIFSLSPPLGGADAQKELQVAGLGALKRWCVRAPDLTLPPLPRARSKHFQGLGGRFPSAQRLLST